MDVVIDTNVFISGLLKPYSITGEIIDMIFSGQITPIFDDRILEEYELVMLRSKFGFPVDIINEFLFSLQTIGKIMIPLHTGVKLPDENDRCFYECALCSETKILITGNKKRFPKKICFEIRLFSPREFVEYFFVEE